jgi:transcriptional regulator with XRE-family HTH domain
MARDICIALGERIRELRQERGWRQIDLAEETGMHENYVSDLEQGRKEICLRMLQAIAAAFRVTMAELLKGIFGAAP